MLKGVNDSEAEARELVRLIAGMPAKVNLIPFNPWPGSAVRTQQPSARSTVRADCQRRRVCLAGAPPRGQDILAACGQLRTESRRERAG